MRIKECFRGIIMLLGLMLTACTTPTGDKVALTKTHIAKIKSLGVCVTADHPFEVKFSRDESGDTGAVVGAATFGLAGAVVGGAIESGAKDAADRSKTKSLRSALGDFDGRAYLEQQLQSKLEQARLFDSLKLMNTNEVAKATAPVDGTLVIRVREWGLRRHQAAGSSELLQVGVDVNVRLVEPGGRKTVWERNDFLLDGDGTPLTRFQSDPGLLVRRLSEVFESYSGRVLNELRYPRAN